MRDKMTFKYFYGNESEQYSFYRIPKLLFTSEYFKDLSSDAKILYGLMCCSSNYLQLHVALYLQPFPRLSQMPHHIIQARLCT